MTTCVTGMHRSGTSMVMSVLYGLGLNVGDPADLIPASPSNPDGHWENVHFVDLDDAVLSALGGGWDCPPPVSNGQGTKGWRDLQHRARELPNELQLHDPWGWKDPRVSLLLPFWLGVYPDLRVIVCLRNPLDVALSLRSRGYSSYAFGLSLWAVYNQRILDTTAPEQRLVTHYRAFFDRPDVELPRLCAFAGLEPSDDAVAAVKTRINPAYRHSRTGLAELIEAEVPSPVIALYRQLCDEAEWWEPVTDGAPREDSGSASVNSTLLELKGTRHHVVALQSALAERERALEEATRAAVARELSVADLTARYDALSASLRDLSSTIQDQIGEVRTAVAALAHATAEQRRDAEYQRLVERIRRVVERMTPPHSTLAVVSRGDPDLLEFHDRTAMHFPRAADGRYAGHHPRDGEEALRELEKVRLNGATLLVIPVTSFWWLDQYGAFANHLNCRSPLVREEDTCVIFTLTEGGVRRAARA